MAAPRSHLGLLPACVFIATVALATQGFGKPSDGNHYVYAQQYFSSQGQALGAGAIFPQTKPYVPTYKEPDQSCSYASITQIGFGREDIGAIEYGWVVDPFAYRGDARPHMFIALRGAGVGPGGRNVYCLIEKSGDCRETAENLRCSGMNNPDPQVFRGAFVPVAGGGAYPGDALTPSEQAFFYIGYNEGNPAWWVQYKDRWIGYIPERGRYFPQPLLGAVKVSWFGEISEVKGESCVGMGNGYLGTDVRSARITNMLYLDSNGRIESAGAHFFDTGDKPVQGSVEGYVGDFYTWKGMPTDEKGPFDAFNYGGDGWNCFIAR